MEKNYTNIKNSFKVLVDTIIEKGVDHSLLCIVGDIFESKSYLNTDDIFQWKAMCHLLKKENIKCIIIPGNHDSNCNSELVRDNISLLTTDYKNIVCLNKTGIYTEIFDDPRLEFHIFSPIDKLIPDFEKGNSNKIQIALLHEPINYASYDNGESISNARFVSKDLKKYDYVLLGDIHLHQFLTNRIAYCGSFVQKNKGEGINKGYILWDLDTGVGIFHPILLKEVYIKIEAIDDTCELPVVTKDQKVRHTQLIYKDCSPEYIEKIKNIIIEKYSYINRIVNNTSLNTSIKSETNLVKLEEDTNQVNKLDEKSGGDQVNKTSLNTSIKTNNHEHIITNILGDDNPLLYDILQHHSAVLRNRNEVNFTTYKINYLCWSNIFCYGENNYINFNEFNNNLVMLNGKNRDGKSSIIDIIIRILFNECERGYKEDIVNKSKNQGYIKISFSINNDVYIIEQIYNRSSKNQQHRLYKNGENITKDTIILTYTFLRTKIGLGDYKDFVNMTTALQNRKFLVDMTQKDFVTLLTKITNIDVLKDVEDETKKEISVIKALNKKLSADIDKIIEIKPSEISEIETTKNTLVKTREQQYKDLEKINNHLLNLSKNYDNTVIPDDLEDSINDTVKKLKSFDVTKISNYNTKGYDLARFEKDLVTVTQELWIHNKKLDSIPKDTVLKIIAQNYDVLSTLNKVTIVSSIKQLQDITYKPNDNKLRDAKLLQNIITNFTNETFHPIEQCNITRAILLNKSDNNETAIKNGLPNYSQISQDINELEKKIQMFNNNFGSLTFTEKCSSCTHNKTNIHNIFDIKHELSKLNELKLILNARSSIELIYANAIKYKNDKQQNEIFKRNQIAIEKNTIITAKNNDYNNAVNELKEVHNKQNWNTLQELQIQLNKFKEYEIQKAISERSRLEYLKIYIDLNIFYLNLSKLYKIKVANGTKNVEIDKLNNLLNITKKNLQNTNTDISHIAESYRIKRSQFDKRNDMTAIHAENLKKLQFLETYKDVISIKTGIPSYVLKNTCRIVENNCNKILQRITDFTISIVFDKDVRVYTIDNDKQIPAQMGSGYQKFVLDLIFRITLTEISSISCPRMIFIDEGFGCLDAENFIEVANVLQKLKSNFDSMIIISHLTELRNYVDLSINIVKKEFSSNVQYGKLSDAEKTTKLLMSVTDNNKRNSDFKKDAKASIKKDTKASAKIIKSIENQTDNEKKIDEYCSINGGIETVLLRNNGDKIYCSACKKEYNSKKNFAEKHLVAVSHKSKHDKFILNLYNNDLTLEN